MAKDNHMRVRGWLVLAALAIAVVLAGCSRADPSIIGAAPVPVAGEGLDTGVAAGPQTIAVAADSSGQLKFQQTELQAEAGRPLAVDFTNPSAVPHNWVLVEPGQEDAVVEAAQAAAGDPTGVAGVIAGVVPFVSGSETISVQPLEAGSFLYVCTVPGHYAAGMYGTLNVGAPVAAGETEAPADEQAGSLEPVAEASPAAAGDDAAVDTGSATVAVAADSSGQLKFQQETLSAPADQPLDVNFTNPSVVPHNWVLVEPGQEDAVATAAAARNGDPAGVAGVIAGMAPFTSGSETVPVEPLAAGEYPYICTVPGHYQAGMRGILTAGQ